MDRCKRCGQCCHWKGIPCRFLKRIGKTKTKCRIYGKHLGTIICIDGNLLVTCGQRKNTTFDYQGCPLNTKKPCDIYNCNISLKGGD